MELSCTESRKSELGAEKGGVAKNDSGSVAVRTTRISNPLCRQILESAPELDCSLNLNPKCYISLLVGVIEKRGILVSGAG